jgi:iron complex outermembrane recepter protein
LKTKPVALALAVSATFGYAQAQFVQTLDPVVVTASRVEEPQSLVPTYVEVYESKDIERSGARSVPDFLTKYASVNSRSTNGGDLGVVATIDLRGFGASAKDNTLVLVDGVRLNPIDGGSVHWSSIPIQAIERIEVLHGSGSVQYGDRAVGGVINIITRLPQGNQTTIQGTAGSYGRGGLSVLEQRVASDSTISLQASAENDDGWRDNSQVAQSQAAMRWGYRFAAGTHLELTTNYSSQRYASPGGVLGEVNQGNRRAAKFNNVDDRTFVNQSSFGLALTKGLGHGWGFKARMSTSDSDQEQRIPNSTTSVKQIQYDKWGSEASVQFEHQNDSGELTVIGLDWSRAFAGYVPNTGDRQDAEVDNLGIFASHRKPFFQDWIATIGGRVHQQAADAMDINQTAGTSAASKTQYARSLQASVSYIPREAILQKVSLTYSRAYRFANTDEFWASSYPAPSYSLVRVFSGILRPQVSDGLDLVANGKAYGIDLSGTIFASQTRDEIRYCVSATCDYGSNINADNINRYGFTGRGLVRVGSNTSINVSGTLQSTKFAAGEFRGKKVALAPNLFLNLGWEWAPIAMTRISLSGRYVGSQRYEGDETNTLSKMPDYWVMDLGASHRQGAWTYAAYVTNLLDKKYSNYGGYGFVSLAPGSSGYSYYYYPGDPVLIRVSVTRRFD